MPDRAFSSDAKAERRHAILDTASELFERIGFRDLSMSLIAERAGLAKGTLYLYFPTKEAVFLGIYQREMASWLDAVETDAADLPANDTVKLAGLLVDCIDAQPRLPPLAALLHTVLERNLPLATVIDSKRAFVERSASLGRVLEERLDFLRAGDGLRLLLRLHALLIGTWQAATPAPIARKALEQPELAELRIDFSEELENTLLLLLEGWRHSEGG